jgi:hypothetical protein
MKRFALAILVVAAVGAGVFLAFNRPGAEASPDATITVNSVADNDLRDGVLTLREALLLATGDLGVGALDSGECGQVSNSTWGPPCSTTDTIGAASGDTIDFTTLASPVALIALGSDLPPLDEGDDTIDASSSSTRWVVDGEDNWCFQITSNNNVVKGLEIYDCQAGVAISGGAQNNTVGGSTQAERNVISGSVYGVEIRDSGTNGNTVKGNYIGTDPSGTVGIPNQDGVFIWLHAQNNTIGGSGPGEGNVISGNDGHGVEIVLTATGTGTGNLVKGNYIGTDASGTVAVPNLYGVGIRDGAQNNTIGGSGPGERNVISGNDSHGVEIAGWPAENNTVKGNFIGTDSSGTVAVANHIGVSIHQARDNTVGGSGPGEGNVISGNDEEGVLISGADTDGNAVKGNFIGTDASGTVAVPNDEGVYISSGAQNNTIGSTGAGEGNLIAFNDGRGVGVSAPDTTGNTIRGNSIHSNGGKGIENDEGGNTELTPPTIDSAGSVFGTACPGCLVDVYSDDEDEGEVYAGSTTADGDGNWSFSGTPGGPNITATATDSDGNTSEFSEPLTPPWPTPASTVTPTATATATATATPTPPDGATRTVVWGPGWHNETWSGASTPAEAFSCAASNYAAAYRYVGGGFQRYFPDRLDISNMTDLAQYDTFFILITDDVTCEMPVADPTGTERTLDWGVGWHNDGWTGADGTDPEDAFSCAADSYAAAYRYVDGGLERHFPDRPEISNMGALDKYDAFLILVTAPVTCTMPIAPLDAP